MKRNRKKVVVVVASLSLALVLLNSIYGLIDGFDMDKFASSMTVSDFSVADVTLDNVSVDLNARVRDGVTEDFLKELNRQDGIEEVGNIYLSLSDPTFTEEDYEKIKKNVWENPLAKEEIERVNSMTEEGYLDRAFEERDIDGIVYGIGKMVMEKLEYPDGELDWEKFSTGRYVIASRFGSMEENEECAEYFHPGETVTLFNEAGESRSYEVLAVAEMPYACGYQVYSVFNCNYILPEQEYLDFMGEQQPMRTLFNVKKEQEEKIQSWLEEYCTNVNSDLDYTSKAKVVKEFESMKNMYSLVGGLLVFVLAVIGILNFMNTMITSVLSRKQEFAMMEAVGMTGKQQRQILQREGICYAVLTGIVSLALGAILDVTAIRSIGSGFFFFTWHFRVTPILICLPFLAAVVFFVPTLCYKSMCRTSVVERMRREE